MVARGCRMIVTGRRQAAARGRDEAEDPSARRSRDLLPPHEHRGARSAHEMCPAAGFERNTRARLSPAPKARELARDPRPNAQSRTDENQLKPALQRRRERRCRITGRRRKGPPRDSAPARLCRLRPCPGRPGCGRGQGSPRSRRETKPIRSQEPIMAELRSVDPRTLQAEPEQSPPHARATGDGRAAARLDQGDRHHPTAHCRREGRRARDQGRQSPGKGGDPG